MIRQTFTPQVTYSRRTPNKNAHVAFFNAILEEECSSKHGKSVHKKYNATRIHSILKYHTSK